MVQTPRRGHNTHIGRHMLRKTLAAAYAAMVAALAAATFVEHGYGTDAAHSGVYGSTWFSALWAAIVLLGAAWMVRRRVKSPGVLLLHVSFAVILAGGLLTKLTSFQGEVHLKQGLRTAEYSSKADGENKPLGFAVKLDSFKVEYYPGTAEPRDYTSVFTIEDRGEAVVGKVSMNNIFQHAGVRFYQGGYDPDMRGSSLLVNADPYGTPLTYAGYALLLVSMVWLLAAPGGAFRRLLRSGRVAKAAMLGIALACCSHAGAAETVGRPQADAFGRLCVSHNGRITLFQTYAKDFVRKLTGSDSYRDYSAEQVVLGFLFYADEWEREPVFKVSGDVSERLGLPAGHVSLSQLFSQGRYLPGPYLGGGDDALSKGCRELDSRVQLVMLLRQGQPFAMFPHKGKGRVEWLSPTFDPTREGVGRAEALFIKNFFALVSWRLGENDPAGVSTLISKLGEYQAKNAGDTMPGEWQLGMERLHNEAPLPKLLFIFCLSAGFALVLSSIAFGGRAKRVCKVAGVCAVSLSFSALTLWEAARWIAGGSLPLMNGYDTMLFMAWVVSFVALLAGRRSVPAMAVALIVSGAMLLVSHLSSMDPAITAAPPVLNSPLLAVHVSIIMVAYSLLSLTFACSAAALAARFGKNGKERMAALRRTSLLLLYPAMATLSVGIFTGAVWANVSWGSYWSWDPKETWALITMMAYAPALHSGSIPFLRRPAAYHAYVGAAFATLLMTYFGVNYLLGGMHSYA